MGVVKGTPSKKIVFVNVVTIYTTLLMYIDDI